MSRLRATLEDRTILSSDDETALCDFCGERAFRTVLLVGQAGTRARICSKCIRETCETLNGGR